MRYVRPGTGVWVPGAAGSAVVVPTAVMREHLRVTETDDDVSIDACTKAAIGHVEKYTQRLLTNRTCVLHMPGLPCGRVPLALPGGVVAALTSITVDGVALTGCTVLGDSPARLVPDADWPTPTGEGFPVVITYTAGYAAGAVPPALIAAVKMLAAELFERREAASPDPVTLTAVGPTMMMRPYRIFAG